MGIQCVITHVHIYWFTWIYACMDVYHLIHFLSIMLQLWLAKQKAERLDPMCKYHSRLSITGHRYTETTKVFYSNTI